MKELKIIWYRDRLFLSLMLVAFVMGFTLFHTGMSHSAQNGARQMVEMLKEWQGVLYNEIDVSENYRQIVIDWFDEVEKADELEQFVNGFLFSFGGDEVVAVCVWAGILLSVCFILKWILENSGRRGEFVSLFPVQSKNVWLAEFLEGFLFIITAGILLIGDICVQQMKMTRAFKEKFEVLARLKDTAYLDYIVIQGLLILLFILFIYALFFLAKELVNVPSILFIILPVTCFIPLIIAYMCYALMPGMEGSNEFLNALLNWGNLELVLYSPYTNESEIARHLLIHVGELLITTIIFIVASRILHTKKDKSSTKLFRFKWAEILYLVVAFCIFFLCVYYRWEKVSVLKNLISIIIAGVMTFAVWLLAERKATTLFQGKKIL